MLRSRWLVKLWQCLCYHSAHSEEGLHSDLFRQWRGARWSHTLAAAPFLPWKLMPQMQSLISQWGIWGKNIQAAHTATGDWENRATWLSWTCEGTEMVPTYSSMASSAPARKNSVASFLAAITSWKNSNEFHSMLLMHRLLFPHKITNWIVNLYV